MATRRMQAVALVLGGCLPISIWAAPPALSGTVRANASAQDQRCFDQDYAIVKRGTVASRRAVDSTGPGDTQDLKATDGAILSQTRPLSEPPEISHVRRGVDEHFTGAHVNDGLESWSDMDDSCSGR